MEEKINLLDYGYVKLVEVMSSDEGILQAARVSYVSNKDAQHTPAQNRALIRYLLRNAHTSPFEMAEVKFEIKCPIFVARQWVRHRTANVNEISGRYSVLPSEMYKPDVYNFRKQSQSNKQGSSDELAPEWLLDELSDVYNEASELYTSMVEEGVAKEQARIVLPLSTYTQFVWKIDVHNFMHFLRLRMDPHAQQEIRIYAEAMYQLAKPYFPLTMEAFDEYALNAVKFSRTEAQVIGELLSNHYTMEEIVDRLREKGVQSKTEVDELVKKLSKCLST